MGKLGEGEFGMVNHGCLVCQDGRKENVAIKTLKRKLIDHYKN